MEFITGNDDFFEGAEKILEVWFELPGRGLRQISREEWNGILDIVGAKIMASSSSELLDSYVLSESSLFVWNDHLVLKTCGVTTLLLAFPVLMKALSKIYGHCEAIRFFYSHKAFVKEDQQEYPHKSPVQEKEFLFNYFPSGQWFDFSNGDKLSQWMVFIYTHSDVAMESDITTEIIMYGLSDDRREQFYKSTFEDSGQQMRFANMMDKILPGSHLDDISFDPYGYSVNGCLDSRYFTIHVTPQSSCSFASFETNISFPDLYRTVNLVLDIFKPSHFCCTVIYTGPFEEYVQQLLSRLSKVKPNLAVDIKRFNEYTINYTWY